MKLKINKIYSTIFLIIHCACGPYPSGFESRARTPKDALLTFSSAIKNRDRNTFLSITKWQDKIEALDHRFLFLDFSEFLEERNSQKLNNSGTLSPKQLYERMLMFEDGIIQLGYDIEQQLESQAITFESKDTATFHYTLTYTKKIEDRTISPYPLQIKRFRNGWYIWNFSCYNYGLSESKEDVYEVKMGKEL